MILREFVYERPSSLEEALALADRHRDRLCPLAGGTDLVALMKLRSILQLTPGAGTPDARWRSARRVAPALRPDVVMSLADVPGLSGMERFDGTFRIGPMATMAEIAASPALPAEHEALRDAASVMGSPLIRNRATIGGNLMNARPAADTAIALVALRAKIRLASRFGDRVIDLEGFFTGPGRTARRPDELLVDVEIPCRAGSVSAYVRLGRRRQLEIPIVCAAAWLLLDDRSGAVSEARISLGAVSPTPLLAASAAAMLVGRSPDADAIAAASRAARAAARPIDDFRGSAAYRLDMVEELVGRAIEAALARANRRGGSR